jgi:hypothetical protein
MSAPRKPVNPWPIGIGVFLGCFLTAMTGFVLFAVWHRTELVAPDYYEQEVRYQSQMERLGRTRALAGQIRVTHDAARRELLIVLPPDHASHRPAGHIQLYRPSDVGLDRRVPLAVDVRGEQVLDATALQPGLWKVRIQWTVQGQEYYSEQQVVVPPRVS